MDRINSICRHPEYIEKMNVIRLAEAGRIYCCHDMDHLLDVARLMYIRSLETGLIRGGGKFAEGGRPSMNEGRSENSVRISKEMIYAAALLHDIGRADQYTNGTPHDEAGAKTAEHILSECGFTPEETELITGAILGHRGDGPSGENGGDTEELFSKMLREADKKSRPCYRCRAADTCKWPDEKKNMEIEV